MGNAAPLFATVLQGQSHNEGQECTKLERALRLCLKQMIPSHKQQMHNCVTGMLGPIQVSACSMPDWRFSTLEAVDTIATHKGRERTNVMVHVKKSMLTVCHTLPYAIPSPAIFHTTIHMGPCSQHIVSRKARWQVWTHGDTQGLPQPKRQVPQIVYRVRGGRVPRKGMGA